MSYLSFSNSMNKANERCPLNCTPASAPLLRSASDSLQQRMKQAPCSLLPSSLTLPRASLPLSPLSGTHTHQSFREHTGSSGFPLQDGVRSALQQAKAGLCAWTRLCPKEGCCCTKHSQVQRIIINTPIFFS